MKTKNVNFVALQEVVESRVESGVSNAFASEYVTETCVTNNGDRAFMVDVYFRKSYMLDTDELDEFRDWLNDGVTFFTSKVYYITYDFIRDELCVMLNLFLYED